MECCQLKSLWVLHQDYTSSWSSSWPSSKMSSKRTVSHQHWIIESVTSIKAWQLIVAQQNKRQKKTERKGNSDIPRFQCKCIVLRYIKLKMLIWFYKSIEHLQDTLLNKLIGQFIELYNTQFFQRPGNFIWDCIVLFFPTTFWKTEG